MADVMMIHMCIYNTEDSLRTRNLHGLSTILAFRQETRVPNVVQSMSGRLFNMSGWECTHALDTKPSWTPEDLHLVINCLLEASQASLVSASTLGQAVNSIGDITQNFAAFSVLLLCS
jgi:hypothetical protein